ncbi:MAG: hypothetical protein K2X47_07480 [Bdellovibrionales bacterium]|nr:hypothetical protein [Bdellovibrionales bacterium]
MSLLKLQILSCAMLTGLIWTIQILHYPCFDRVSGAGFEEFHLFHTRRITFLVLPLMILDLASGIALVVYFPDSELMKINLLAVLMIWMVTFFISVPIHQRLSNEKSTVAIRRLISTNWLRTALWSARSCLLLFAVDVSFDAPAAEAFTFVRGNL